MTSLAIVIAVMAFVAMRRARRCHGYYGWCGPFGYGWYGPHGWHKRSHARARWMLHALFSRIDATPAQERAVDAACAVLADRCDAGAGARDRRRGREAAGPAARDQGGRARCGRRRPGRSA